MNEGIQSLLGASRESSEVQAFLNGLDEAAQPTVDEDGRTTLTVMNLGLELQFSAENLLTAVFFIHEPPAAGPHVRPYAGELPRKLNFSMSRAAVHETLGQPDWSAEPEIFLNFELPPRDRYDGRDHQLHLRYSAEEDRITMVTLSAERHRSTEQARRELQHGPRRRGPC